MVVSELAISGLRLIELNVHRDERGFFVERFNQTEFRRHGLPVEFCQDNWSRSNPGVLRGLHFQEEPSQGKLIGVIHGHIWDVVVDIRRGSPTFGQSHGIELSDANGRLLWVPSGFAHGYCVLGDQPADLAYKVDRAYSPQGEGGIFWSDPDLKIDWPVPAPTLSARDQRLPSWKRFCGRLME